MDDLKIIKNVVARHLQAGPVVPFSPKKPRVPQITIAGKKYNLSTFGGSSLGDREDDDKEETYQGARLIRPPPGANKWKYLWAYDTEKSIVAMWRVSDGNEKVWESANSQISTVVALDRKGQINRISNAEFRKIDAEMRKRENETIQDFEKSLEESKTELTKQVDKLVEEYFESHVAPKLDRAITSVERGATPLGFDFNERVPSTKKHQMISFAFYQTMKAEMSMNAVSKYLISKGIDVDEAGQWIDWAIQDVNEKAYAAYVPREGLTAFKYVPKEKKVHKVERLTEHIKDTTGLSTSMSESIADAFVRGRDVIRLSIPKNWPIEDGIIMGPSGELSLESMQPML